MKKPKGQIVAIFIQTTMQQCAIKPEKLEQSRHTVTPKLSVSAAVNCSAESTQKAAQVGPQDLGPTCFPMPCKPRRSKEMRGK